MHQNDPKSQAKTLLGCLLMALVAGCSGEAAIETYEVEKESPPRILVATVQDGPQVWFFKFSGSRAQVEAHVDEFNDFLDSVKFVRGEPTWDVPAGWIESERGKTGSFKRFASLARPTPTELIDVSVTTLTAPATGIDDTYLMINLNRWRKQVSLDPVVESESWKEGFTAISIDGVPGLLADITGEIHLDLSPRRIAQAAPQTRDPHAGGPMREPQFEYSVPEHWQDRGASPMVEKEWRVGKGEANETVRITLSFAGGGLVANIDRWRGQVGLPNAPADNLGATDFVIDEKPAMLFDLVGKTTSIVGIVAEQEGPFALFVKITGPAKMVEDERVNFLKFAATLKVNN